MKNILRIGAKLLVVFFALLGVLHVASSCLSRYLPASPFDEVIRHREDLRANDQAALLDLAALARRFQTDKALVAQLKPINSEARARTQTLFIPKSMLPASYSRAEFFDEEPFALGRQALLVCDREGKPLSMHFYSGRRGGLFIGIDPNAIPHGDNLMLKVYEYPEMYVFAHAP